MFDDTKMTKIDYRHEYLTVEKLMREFFQQVNFCGRFCPKVDKSIGCCACNYYYDDDRFVKGIGKRLCLERSVIYGKPKENRKKCNYHEDGVGCKLVTHRSCLCNSFICLEMKHFLRIRFGIDYDHIEVDRNLREMIRCKAELINVKLFKALITVWIMKVKQVNSRK
ncbi:hypothetical protein COT97_05745 [Candidatus Falkowbacteria bacterium CG10_big_fil_rev_8_21_14_0_10_39_11]|uniref:Uncharacterized protein n=1 Tax=Candidatus Falkowbacteria bacterium CG10_big_fil_rev_8_21_14_0_10_39_11 TaxID=1974565 RepID=A0A2H0V5I7_9BACT|nr:MAG: hypothetical protein COT97_05745 [Candidatus Falkowbacteria bacterium CG10_big_fil_rev_8_21_14_0_10_39_11]